MWKRSQMPLVCGLLALVRAWFVLDGQVKLVFVAFGLAAVLRAAIGERTTDYDRVLVKKGTTRSFVRSAAVSGVLRSYSLANATLA